MIIEYHVQMADMKTNLITMTYTYILLSFKAMNWLIIIEKHNDDELWSSWKSTEKGLKSLPRRSYLGRWAVQLHFSGELVILYSV